MRVAMSAFTYELTTFEFLLACSCVMEPEESSADGTFHELMSDEGEDGRSLTSQQT